jgi:hypothetical protein
MVMPALPPRIAGLMLPRGLPGVVAVDQRQVGEVGPEGIVRGELVELQRMQELQLGVDHARVLVQPLGDLKQLVPRDARTREEECVARVEHRALVAQPVLPRDRLDLLAGHACLEPDCELAGQSGDWALAAAHHERGLDTEAPPLERGD